MIMKKTYVSLTSASYLALKKREQRGKRDMGYYTPIEPETKEPSVKTALTDLLLEASETYPNDANIHIILGKPIGLYAFEHLT